MLEPLMGIQEEDHEIRWTGNCSSGGDTHGRLRVVSAAARIAWRRPRPPFVAHKN